MAIVCPACNKANQTEDVCQRCACELLRLHEIVAAAGSRLSMAAAALTARDWSAALAHAERSWSLCRSRESARTAFLAAAAAGDTARALCWRERTAHASTVYR